MAGSGGVWFGILRGASIAFIYLKGLELNTCVHFLAVCSVFGGLRLNVVFL